MNPGKGDARPRQEERAPTESAGETNTATLPRGADISHEGRMPCRTRGCTGTRPLTLLGSSRGWDKCSRCMPGVLPRDTWSAYADLCASAEFAMLVEAYGSPAAVLAAVREHARAGTEVAQ